MNKKPNICLVDLVFHKAFISPSSNLEKILFTLSHEFYNIKGVSNNLNIENNKEHVITHKESNNGFLRILRYIFLQLKISFKLISLREKIDICIFFTESGLLLPIITSKLLGKKVLWQLPSSLKKMLYYNNDSFSFFLNGMQELSYNFVDNIILYSPSLINEWELEKYRNKILIAHEHIINTKKFKIMKDYDKRDYLIGYVGRLSKEKGICNFVNAMSEISKKRNDLKFLIVGDGNLKKEISNYLRDNKLDNKVNLIKWISHDKLPNYLNKMKLIVLPSYTEGLPNVMLESMACGTPVLANSVGSVKDIIKNRINGFIMEDNSIESITETILEMVEFLDSDISLNANKFIENNFVFEKTVHNWNNIIEELTN